MELEKMTGIYIPKQRDKNEDRTIIIDRETNKRKRIFSDTIDKEMKIKIL